MRATYQFTGFPLALAVVLLLAACAAPPAASQPPAAALAQESQPASPDPTAAVPEATPAPGAEPIKIGVALAQTEEYALYGLDQIKGAKIAEAFFNERGGVNGRPVQLVFADTRSSDDGAKQAYETLIAQGVVGIIGPDVSQQAFAVNPVADRAGVPVLGPATTAKGIPEIGPYIARVAAPDDQVAPYAVTAALTINPDIRTVVALYARDDTFSTGESAVFQRTITNTYQLDLANVATFSTEDTDFAPLVSSVMQRRPDLVIVSGLVNSGQIVKQLRDSGYVGLIVAGDGMNTGDIFGVCKAACNHVILAQRYNWQAAYPINQIFVERFRAAYESDPSQDPALVFTAVQVFVESLVNLDRAEPVAAMDIATLRAKLNTQLLGGSYETPIGRISFTPDGEVRQDRMYAVRIDMEPNGDTGKFTHLVINNTRR